MADANSTTIDIIIKLTDKTAGSLKTVEDNFKKVLQFIQDLPKSVVELETSLQEAADGSDELAKALDIAANEMKKTESAIEQVTDGSEKLETAAEHAGQGLEQTGEAAEQATQQLEKAGVSAEQAELGLEKTGESAEQAGQGLEKTGASAEKAKQGLSKSEKAAQKAEAQLQKLQKVSKIEMVMNATDKASKFIDTVLEKGHSLSGKVWSVTLKAVDLVTAPFKSIFGGLKSLAGGIMNPIMKGIGMSAGLGLGSLVSEFIENAGRMETLNIAMNAVARSTGTSTERLNEYKNEVKELGIADQEATQIMTRFMQGELDIAQASKVARVAQDAAVIAGVNSSEASETMVEAISKLSPQLLTQFGMTKNLNDIYADYAKSIGIVVTTKDKYGKSVRHMTRDLKDAEKKQAMLNYVLAEGAKISGTYEDAMNSPFKKLGSLKRYSTTLMESVGTPLFMPVFGKAVDGATKLLKNAISWAKDNKALLEDYGKKAADWLSGAMNKAEAFGHKISSIFQSADFKDANIFGKVKILWDEVIAKPFDDWWNGKGKTWITDKAGEIGRGLGKAISTTASALLGFDMDGSQALEDGKSIGSAFIDGFLQEFDGDKVTEALKKILYTAIKLVFSNPVTGTIATTFLAGKGLSMVAPVLGTARNTGQFLGGMGKALKGGSALTTVAGAGSTAATAAGSGSGMATLGASVGVPALAVTGAALGVAGVISGIRDLNKSFKTYNSNSDEAMSGFTKIGMVGLGAAIGTAIAPGIGTAIGAGIGGLAGLIAGKNVGHTIGGWIDGTGKMEKSAKELHNVTKAFEETRDKTDRANKAIKDYYKTIEDISNSNKKGDDLTKNLQEGSISYDQYKKEIDKINQANKEVSDAQKQNIEELQEMYPGLITKYDIENKKLDDKLALITKINEAEKKSRISKLKATVAEGRNNFADLSEHIEKSQAKQSGWQQKVDNLYGIEAEALDLQSEWLNAITAMNTKVDDPATSKQKMESIRERILDLNNQTGGIFSISDFGNGNVDDVLKKEIDKLIASIAAEGEKQAGLLDGLYNQYLSEVALIEEQYNIDFNADLNALDDLKAQLADVQELSKLQIELKPAMEDFQTVQDLASQIEELSGLDLSNVLEDPTAILKQLNDLDLSGLTKEQTDVIEQFNNSLELITNFTDGFASYTDLAEKYGDSDLASKQEEINKKIEELSNKLAPAIEQITELNKRFNLLPTEKKINVDVIINGAEKLTSLGVSDYKTTPNSPLIKQQNSVQDLFNTSPKSVTPHAEGGIMTKPHEGLVAEAGPEAIIPLSSGKRERALGLWQEVGKLIGVNMDADSYYMGDSIRSTSSSSLTDSSNSYASDSINAANSSSSYPSYQSVFDIYNFANANSINKNASESIITANNRPSNPVSRLMNDTYNVSNYSGLRTDMSQIPEVVSSEDKIRDIINYSDYTTNAHSMDIMNSRADTNTGSSMHKSISSYASPMTSVSNYTKALTNSDSVLNNETLSSVSPVHVPVKANKYSKLLNNTYTDLDSKSNSISSFANSFIRDNSLNTQDNLISDYSIHNGDKAYSKSQSNENSDSAINNNNSFIRTVINLLGGKTNPNRIQHMGLIAEDGAEAMIPLSPDKHDRAVDLWQNVGRLIGIKTYADGGITDGFSGSSESPSSDMASASSAPAAIEIPISINNVTFKVEVPPNSSPDTILKVIRENMGNLTDEIAETLAEAVRKIFANTPMEA